MLFFFVQEIFVFMGFYKWDYTPTFRGYDSFLGYYTGGEDYYTHISSGYYDLRYDKEPNCGQNCSQVYTKGNNIYSANLFSNRAIDIIKTRGLPNATDTPPLFMYLAYQSVHSPYEVPEKYTQAPFYNNTYFNCTHIGFFFSFSLILWMRSYSFV